jgi:hypothetical protein
MLTFFSVFSLRTIKNYFICCIFNGIMQSPQFLIKHHNMNMCGEVEV